MNKKQEHTISIQYTTRAEENTLFVRASGFDENLEDVENYAQGVIDATLQHGTALVLCDETALDYRLCTVDTYEVGKFLASRVPRVFKIAIVCNTTFNADARFYKTVVVNRGLNLRMFSDIEKARRKPGAGSRNPSSEQFNNPETKGCLQHSYWTGCRDFRKIQRSLYLSVYSSLSKKDA